MTAALLSINGIEVIYSQIILVLKEVSLQVLVPPKKFTRRSTA